MCKNSEIKENALTGHDIQIHRTPAYDGIIKRAHIALGMKTSRINVIIERNLLFTFHQSDIKIAGLGWIVLGMENNFSNVESFCIVVIFHRLKIQVTYPKFGRQFTKTTTKMTNLNLNLSLTYSIMQCAAVRTK